MTGRPPLARVRSPMLAARVPGVPVVLPRHGLARLVAVARVTDRALLLHLARIPGAGVRALVHRQRRGARNPAVVPAVPAGATNLPVAAPPLAPARRPVRVPAAEVRGRLTVVAHRDAQHVVRDVVGLD